MDDTGDIRYTSGRPLGCPILNPDDTNYEIWRKQAQVWRSVTTYPKKKQGSIVFLAMKGKARDHINNMDLERLEGDNGFEEILKVLDEIYMPEIFEKKYRNFNDLWSYCRKPNESMPEWSGNWHAKYINYEKVAGNIPSETAAMMLLTAARLTGDQRQSIRLHMGTEITYAKMREIIKIKFVAAEEPQESSDMFFNGQGDRRRDELQSYGGNKILWNKGYKNKDRSYRPRSRERYTRPIPRERSQRPNNRRRDDDSEDDNDDEYRRKNMNSMRNGRRTTCNYCGSKFHYRRSCKDYKNMLRDNSDVREEKKFAFNY